MDQELAQLQEFLFSVQRPLVIVSTLLDKDRKAVIRFLRDLKAPVYLEAVSGIREKEELQPLRISCSQRMWTVSEQSGYPIDGILRIGGVPTLRAWRDLEEKNGVEHVLSISCLPFSGLSWGKLVCADISDFFTRVKTASLPSFSSAAKWREQDNRLYRCLVEALREEPDSEPGIISWLSTQIPKKSVVFLGNSLPIREWDLGATVEDREYQLFANRGINGIDGQISTFLGMASKEVDNWGIFGDLTALYDFSALWILKQLQEVKINLVVINNFGGKIFSRMFEEPAFQNNHQLQMRLLADFWRLDYCGAKESLGEEAKKNHRLIELIPCEEATCRFWQVSDQLFSQSPVLVS